MYYKKLIEKARIFCVTILLAYCFPVHHALSSDNALLLTHLDETDLFNSYSDTHLSAFETDLFDTLEDESTHQIKASPQDIITLLDTLGAIALIMEPFFLATNQLNKRSLLDNPLFLPYGKHKKKRWALNVNSFYLSINRSHLTKKCDQLSSYLALTQETLLEKLENSAAIFKAFNPSFDFDIRLVFSLFTNMTVEERHAGFMFDVAHYGKHSFFRLLIPWYYLERNFSLTPAEKKKVEEEFGAVDPQEQEAFQKDHLVSDKFGLGDARLEWGHHLFKTTSTTIHVGVQATIPTAFKWFNGPNGSTYPRPNNFPTLDTDLFFTLIEDPTITNQELVFNKITALGLGALDRLAATLLDAPLGNARHLGVGIFEQNHLLLDHFFPKARWARGVVIDSRISLEYLLPAHEKRFFINKVNKSAFAARDFDDPTQDQQNLDFLTQELIARYYMRAYSVSIQPGIIFRWTSQASGQARIWGWHAGSDLWIQSKETIESIRAPKNILDQLDVAKAKGFMAYQSTIFGGIVYKMQRSLRTWFLSLNGETTYSHTGIGAQWGINISVKTDF